MNNLYIPALRGFFGDWAYYSCIMSFQTISELVSFADDLHKSKKLSEMIQRAIKRRRGNEIAEYLINEKERFFNSLVIAVYGGSPSWHSIGITSSKPTIKIEDISESYLNSFGFLQFTGKERLFAIDGQHRLSGIKKAIVDGNQCKNDEVSVLLVAHNSTQTGLQRTRRLFTTLNKTAVKISKGEIITLDENDVMAIIVRRLVEENPFFMNNRVAYKQTNNIAPKDNYSLTTIGNLYDVLAVIFSTIPDGVKIANLKTIRPNDAALDDYYEYASNFFKIMAKYFPNLNSFFNAKDTSKIIEKKRGSFGGDILFRPLGLLAMTEVISKICAKYGLEESVRKVSILPQDLQAVPYVGVLWSPYKEIIISKGRVLVRDLLFYMLGEKLSNQKLKTLKERYAKALDMAIDEISLPKSL